MAEQTNPFDKTAQEGSRFGFVADLAFVLCFVWLALWRAELFAADPESVWAGGWPALILGGLVAAAFAIGLAAIPPPSAAHASCLRSAGRRRRGSPQWVLESARGRDFTADAGPRCGCGSTPASGHDRPGAGAVG